MLIKKNTPEVITLRREEFVSVRQPLAHSSPSKSRCSSLVLFDTFIAGSHTWNFRSVVYKARYIHEASFFRKQMYGFTDRLVCYIHASAVATALTCITYTLLCALCPVTRKLKDLLVDFCGVSGMLSSWLRQAKENL